MLVQVLLEKHIVSHLRSQPVNIICFIVTVDPDPWGEGGGELWQEGDP
jgi:hypothetical protein